MILKYGNLYRTCTKDNFSKHMIICNNSTPKRKYSAIFLTCYMNQIQQRKHEQNLNNQWPQEQLGAPQMAQMTRNKWSMQLSLFENYKTDKNRYQTTVGKTINVQESIFSKRDRIYICKATNVLPKCLLTRNFCDHRDSLLKLNILFLRLTSQKI